MLHGELGAVVRNAPGDVVNAARTPGSLLFRRRLLDVQYSTGASASKRKAAPPVLVANLGESQRIGEKVYCRFGRALQEPYAMEPPDLPRLGNRALLPRGELALVAGLGQHDGKPMRISKAQNPLTEAYADFTSVYAVAFEPVGPVLEAAHRNRECHFHRQPHTGATRRHIGPRKEGQIRS